jgi:photosystem II stability/assembly factor-like uncharacterized protein
MKSSLLLVISFLLFTPLHAQWVEKWTGISTFANIRYLEITQNLVVAGTSNGVYISQNNGDTWVLESEIGTSDFRAVASSPGFIYAANTSRILRKNLLTSIWDTLLEPGEIAALAVSGNLIYAGLKNGGVFRSENLGMDWTSLEAVPNSPNGHRALLAFGDTVLSGTDGDGVYRSTDRGNTWEKVNNGDLNADGDDIRTFAKTGNTMFLSTKTNGIFRSIDKGLTWQAVNSGITNLNSRGLTAINQKVFAGFNEGGGVYQSVDLGNSWTNFTGEIPANFEVRTLATNGLYLYAGCQDGRIFRTTIGTVATDSVFSKIVPNMVWNMEKGEISLIHPHIQLKDVKIYDALGRTIYVRSNVNHSSVLLPFHPSERMLFVAATLSSGDQKVWRLIPQQL